MIIEVKNNINLMPMEQVLDAQVVMLHRKYLKITEANKNKIKLNSTSKVSLHDHSVGLILILVGLKKMLAHVKLVSIGKYFKYMMKHKIKYIFKTFVVPIGNSKFVQK